MMILFQYKTNTHYKGYVLAESWEEAKELALTAVKGKITGQEKDEVRVTKMKELATTSSSVLNTKLLS